MSTVLATNRLPDERETIEGRLADMVANAEVKIDEYRLSDADRRIIWQALNESAARKNDRSAKWFEEERK